MSSEQLPDDISALGSILSVWAHPDDETYLAAGVMAAAAARGQRVVCLSATAGERGTADPERWPPDLLADVRRAEAAAVMAVLGVDEHHVLGLPDGGLRHDDRDGVDLVEQWIDDVRPDTILTFGPDGVTYHPDHIAVHRWVTAAWQRRGGTERLLYATSTREHLVRFRDLYEEWGVYMSDHARPLGFPAERLALHLRLDGEELERKLRALRAMPSQTRAVMDGVDPATFAATVAEEAFVDARLLAASLAEGEAHGSAAAASTR